MKQHDGFIKNSDVNVLLAGGGHKPLSEIMDWDNISNKSVYTTRWPTWDEVSSKPSTFTSSSHNHNWTEILGRPIESTSYWGGNYSWNWNPMSLSNMVHIYGGTLTNSSVSSDIAIFQWFLASGPENSSYMSMNLSLDGNILCLGRFYSNLGLLTPGSITTGGGIVVENNTIWVLSSTPYSGSSNRMSLSAGHPVGLEFSDNNSINKAGVRIWANGIGIKDSYYAGRNANDSCWIRHVEESNNAGYMEIATGDDGTEIIYFRHYNTSSTVSYESYIYAGTMYARGFSSTSDISLKYNIKPISNILPIYLFNWKQDGKKSYGFIALYLQLDMPEIVGGIKEKTVNYAEALSYYLAKLSNIVIEKDLATNSRINLLEKRMLELENKINTN